VRRIATVTGWTADIVGNNVELSVVGNGQNDWPVFGNQFESLCIRNVKLKFTHTNWEDLDIQLLNVCLTKTDNCRWELSECKTNCQIIQNGIPSIPQAATNLPSYIQQHSSNLAIYNVGDTGIGNRSP